MADAKKGAEEKLKDEKEMKESYELMLRLGMVEMVNDLDLLGRKAGGPKKDPGEDKKDGTKK